MSGHTRIEPEMSGHTCTEPEMSGHTRIEPEMSGHTRIEPDMSGHTRIEPEMSGHTRTERQMSGHTVGRPWSAICGQPEQKAYLIGFDHLTVLHSKGTLLLYNTATCIERIYADDKVNQDYIDCD
jgi:hypothetical protein